VFDTFGRVEVEAVANVLRVAGEAERLKTRRIDHRREIRPSLEADANEGLDAHGIKYLPGCRRFKERSEEARFVDRKFMIVAEEELRRIILRVLRVVGLGLPAELRTAKQEVERIHRRALAGALIRTLKDRHLQRVDPKARQDANRSAGESLERRKPRQHLQSQ